MYNDSLIKNLNNWRTECILTKSIYYFLGYQINIVLLIRLQNLNKFVTLTYLNAKAYIRCFFIILPYSTNKT